MLRTFSITIISSAARDYAHTRMHQVLRSGKKAAIYDVTVAYRSPGDITRPPSPSMLSFMGGTHKQVDIRFVRIALEDVPATTEEVVCWLDY